MIQRKQTLYVLFMILLNCALMFVPVADVIRNELSTHVFLVPFTTTEIVSTMGHFTAIAINFSSILIGFAVIFLYKKRNTQIRLIYLLLLLWALLGSMMAWCPFVVRDEATEGIIMRYFTASLCIPALVAGFLAIRAIRKDIALLKSADRIR